MTDLERQVAELVQRSTAGKAPPQDLLLAMIGLQKLARSSRTAFRKHWPTAISIAQELVRSASAPSHIRGAAYAFLSFDRLLHYEFAQAEEWAVKAQDVGHNQATYCLAVSHYLSQEKPVPKEADPMVLMNEIERCLIDSKTLEPEVSQHQCYLFALHLGLAHAHDKLVAKAETYLHE